jgi:F-type H+-transporting ATPase subunit delta
MTTSAVATRYANALADVLAGAHADPAAALAQLKSFGQLMASSHDLKAALETPSVPASRKRAVVGIIGQKLELSQIARNLLFVLIDRKRIGSLGEILESLELVLDERAGIASAQVSTAAELNGSQRSSLVAELEKLTGKRIRAAYAVDASLIGGVVAKVGSTVYDGSVRGSLRKMERRLAAQA